MKALHIGKKRWEKRWMPDFDDCVYQLDVIRDMMNDDERNECILHEMKIDKTTSEKYCQELNDFVYPDCCGRNNCNSYKQNGNARRCKYKKSCYTETGRKYRIKLNDDGDICVFERIEYTS